MQYQLKLQQLVTYSRCRIYRNFIRTLAEDTNIRLNGDSYLFYFMMLCSLANFRTSYMQVDGISYTIAPGEWMITSRDMMKLLRKKTMKSIMEVMERLSDKKLITYLVSHKGQYIKFSMLNCLSDARKAKIITSSSLQPFPKMTAKKVRWSDYATPKSQTGRALSRYPAASQEIS